jgi:hypothetical protein
MKAMLLLPQRLNRHGIEPNFVLSLLALLRDRLAAALVGERMRPHDEWVNRIVVAAIPAELPNAADQDRNAARHTASTPRAGNNGARESSRFTGRLSARQSARRRMQRALKARLRLKRRGDRPLEFIANQAR